MAELGRVALLGAKGMLGQALEAALARLGARVASYARPHFDLSDPRSLEAIFESRPRFVVNAAAYTAVDRAEEEEELATRVNGAAPRLLARLAAERGARLVHFSTDYVFDGSAREPYPVSAPRAPINAYGRSKAAGEVALGEELPDDHLLIRTSWVYAPWGNNFVRTLAKLARERETLRVVDDQRGRPTSAEGLAESAARLMGMDARGTFHVTDGGECTWYGLARAIVELTGAGCRVEPCASTEYPRPAARPAYSVLDTRGAEALLGELRPWREAVRAALAAPP